jgi:hypothetical protein
MPTAEPAGAVVGSVAAAPGSPERADPERFRTTGFRALRATWQPSSWNGRCVMAVVGDVLALGSELERSYPVYVRGRLKFRVKQIVYVAFSLDELVMGFAFPKEERAALVAGEPAKFRLPSESDMRFNWVHAELPALDPTEAREFVVDAWRMVVPQKVSRAYDLAHPDGPG